jgi:hypothetical protein
MKTTAPDATFDRLRVEAQLEQLRSSNNPVLAVSKLPHPCCPLRVIASVPHRVPNASLGADSPLGAVVRPRHAARYKARSARGFGSTV